MSKVEKDEMNVTESAITSAKVVVDALRSEQRNMIAALPQLEEYYSLLSRRGFSDVAAHLRAMNEMILEQRERAIELITRKPEFKALSPN